ncbi:hypothetical protein [Shewanella gelidii]|uniref:Uncharacterized protein n=1 Tax=Shewanella gelidii TaxID=1642821 RepID=A0A917N6T2_9GAMM|nr:hypothetical protein [Shewanella gelidii]MCL1097069.1 hypothetical protein [Shewanella gelidii]GGI72352.1 hypothetical protein GCM10009332_07160 [Shewanella gelidii]
MKTFSPRNIVVAASLLIVSQVAYAEQDIEVIKVTHRDPVDYALYVHTTETIALLRLELTQQIYDQARDNSLEMAKDFGVVVEPNIMAQQQNKHLAQVWLSQVSE